MACCDIWERFDVEKNLIKEYEYWKLAVRNSQKTLGSCVLITKRHFEAMGELTEDEAKEFAVIAKELEDSYKKLWQPHLVQYAVMKWYDKHMHYHILPRHKEPINFAGIEWIDNQTPNAMQIEGPDIDQDILNKIKQKMIENLI